MANVISNFLVGLGFDYDNKGAKDFDSGMDQMITKGKRLGAVLGGAFGIKKLTADFADAKNSIDNFSTVMSVNRDTVQAFGSAIEEKGGNLESFMSQLGNLERMRAGLQVGDAGWIAQVGKAKIDPNIITNAKDANEAILNLAKAFEKLTPQQRLNAGQALGFDKSMILMLSQGETKLSSIVDKYRDIRPLTADMVKDTQEFKRLWTETGAEVGSVFDKLSASVLPQVNNLLKTVNQGLDTGRDTFEGSPSEDILGGYGGGVMHSLYSTVDAVTGGAMTKADQYLPSYQGIKDFLNYKPFEEMSKKADSHPVYGKSDVFGTIKNSFIDDKPRQLTTLDNPTYDKSWSAMSQMRPDKPVQPNITVNMPKSNDKQPITIQHKTILDGKVVDDRIETVLGRAAETAISQIETNVRS